MTTVYDANFINSFLVHLPEEVAFRWVFGSNAEFLEAPTGGYVWPYNKERTLKALNHKKRSAAELRDFFLPLFAGRPDILLEIIQETNRVTVIKGALGVASVQHTPPAQYQELRLAASEKVNWYELPTRLGQWFFHYGDEAVAAFVWEDKTEVIVDDEGNQRSVEVLRPDVYLTGLTHDYEHRYYAGIATRSSSFKEFINQAKPKTASQLSSALYNYSARSEGEFTLEELAEYMRENSVSLVLNGRTETKDWFMKLPQHLFAGIREAKRTCDTLVPFIVGVDYMEGVDRAINDHLRSASSAASVTDLDRYVLASFDQYDELHASDFYDFVPNGIEDLEPIGELSGAQFARLSPHIGHGEAGRHLAYRFAYNWEAVCAHAARFPRTPVQHLAFNPYEKVIELLKQPSLSSAERAGFACMLQTMQQEEHSEVPEFAREALELFASGKSSLQYGDLAEDVRLTLARHFTTEEVHETYIASAEKRILENTSASECESIFEYWTTSSYISIRTKNSNEFSGGFHTSEYCQSIARALRFLGTDTKEEAAVRRFMRMLTATRFEEVRAHTYFAEAMGHHLDPQNPLWSVQQVLEAADQESTELGMDLVTRMTWFLGKGSERGHYTGMRAIETDSEFRKFVLRSCQDSNLMGLPDALHKYHIELVVAGELNVSSGSCGTLWDPEVVKTVQAAFAGEPVETWETFRDLAKGWEGNLPDLIETAIAVS